MHIAIVIDSLRIGGAEILAIRLGKGFMASGHSVSIIALGGDGPLAALLNQAGISHLTLNFPTGVRFVAMWRLFMFLRTQHYDLIISNHFRQLVHTWMPATLVDIPHYHIEHDNNLYKTKKKYLLLLRIFLTRVIRLIVISPTLETWFRVQLPKQSELISLISTGIDIDVFSPSLERKRDFRKDNSLDKDCIIFATCARLEPIKNISLMLRIFHHHHTLNPNSRLLLLGDGSCREQLELEAQQLGITRYVFFEGLQPEVAPWLQAIDVYLVTSEDEGLPLSVLEAMACGVPVVVRSVGDLPRLINESLGRLVEGQDMKEWQKAIDQIAVTQEIYSALSYNARKLVADEYSLTNCVAQYLQLFQNTAK